MVGLGQELVACKGGGNCLKYLKRGWNRNEGRGNKDIKKGVQAGSRGGCLKKGGWNPLTNYALEILVVKALEIISKYPF